ncbi:MAG: lipase, partial [Muribaculaceae bacterium]|nr:lipase [Muribaculaceae bacterium]
AQCQVVARSGIGIYRNNNGNVMGDKNVMPAIYPYMQFAMSGEKWDFSKYTPDVVCVNLGTNDTTNPRYEISLLTDAYKKFLKTLRGHYPNAKIVLLTGTMLKGQRLADVKKAHQDAIADAKARGDNEVYSFDFTPDDGSLGKGVFNHPSRKRHEKMAEELVPFIREITGWE